MPKTWTQTKEAQAQRATLPRRANGCVLYQTDLERFLTATGVPFRRAGSRCHWGYAPISNLRPWSPAEEQQLMQAAQAHGGGQITRRGVVEYGTGFDEVELLPGRGFRVYSGRDERKMTG